MNTLLAWVNSPEWMIVVKTLLHTLWQAGGFALLLWIALRRTTTPSTRYRLTLGTLAAILGATLLTWAVLNQSAIKSAAPDFTSPTTPTSKPSDVSPVANFGEPSVIAYSTLIAKPAEETRWSSWLALAWLLGTALMLTRAGIQVAGAERLRRSSKPLEDSRITQLLTDAQRALNLTRRIRVAVTDKLTSPAVVGVIVPTLILPLTLLSTLTPEQIRFILLHELAHIRRGDYFANLFQLFIEALLFFNPAVWWISHQVRREREACCDALAIELSGAPVDYARTLLHVAETVLNPPPSAAPAFSDNQREPSSLTDRVQRLLVPGYRPALRLTWRAMLAAIVVGGTLLFLSAIGARNVVGAVSTNASEKATNQATNVIETTDTRTLNELIKLDKEKFSTPTSFQRYEWYAPGEGSSNTSNNHVLSTNQRYAYAAGGGLYVVTTVTNSPSTHQASVFPFRNFPFGNNDGWFAPSEPHGTNPVKVINLSRPNYAISKRGNLIPYESSDYSDGTKKLPPLYNKTAADSISLSADASTRTPSLDLRTQNQRDKESFFYGVGSGNYTTNTTHSTNQLISTKPPLVKGKGRASISNKLDQITFDRISFDRQPLTTVIKTVSDRARKLDPDKRGVNLILNPNNAASVASTNAQPPSAAPEPPLIYISVNPELTNATLRQVLNAIVNGADQRIVYHIEEYAVVVSLKGYEIVPLETRKFHIDPDTFLQGLDAVTGLFPDIRSTNGSGGGQSGQSISVLARTNSMETVHGAVRKFFATLGIDLNPAVGKTVFYNDREGWLFVRATSDELNTIEQAILVMNTKPPQVNIKIRWVVIPEKFIHSTAALFGTNGFSSSAGETILSDSQMKEVIRRIERGDEIKLLNEGQVTTLTERQAQFSVSEMKTIVTGIKPAALTQPGVISTNKEAAVTVETRPTPLGPIFDVLPKVMPDNASISLQTIGTLTDFLGYDKPTSTAAVYVNGKKQTTTFPLPKFRILQSSNDCVVPDGQTLVIGRYSEEIVTTKPDGTFDVQSRKNVSLIEETATLNNKVPILGDLPLIRGLFRSQTTQTNRSQLLLLVTPTIIDPASNRAKPRPILNR